jgi:hypothetical protein
VVDQGGLPKLIDSISLVHADVASEAVDVDNLALALLTLLLLVLNCALEMFFLSTDIIFPAPLLFETLRN